MIEEMLKFRQILDQNDIEWQDASQIYGIHKESQFGITRTHFEYNDKIWSVVHGYGTYGGYILDEKDKGLLEIYDFISDPIGYLTAEEAWKIIKGE